MSAVHSLQIELAEVAQLELTLDEGGGRGAHRRRAGWGECLDPFPQRGRVADRDKVHVHVVADPADDHLAGVEAAACGELRLVAAENLGG